jgi:hypothetical protein
MGIIFIKNQALATSVKIIPFMTFCKVRRGLYEPGIFLAIFSGRVRLPAPKKRGPVSGLTPGQEEERFGKKNFTA